MLVEVLLANSKYSGTWTRWDHAGVLSLACREVGRENALRVNHWTSKCVICSLLCPLLGGSGGAQYYTIIGVAMYLSLVSRLSSFNYCLGEKESLFVHAP